MNLAYLWVALGGALGSVGRFWAANLITASFGGNFPLGTLIINITGSFLIGIFAGLGLQSRATAMQLLMVGICGGYTTFSAFSLQTLQLFQKGAWLYAGGNILLSVLFCLIAVWLGYLLGSVFNSAR